MEVQENFAKVAGLICEPTRAKMLWQLLDGKANTASELATTADISATSASNHLSKLLEANIVKVETQGRHRYYALSSAEVAYAVEALANLANAKLSFKQRHEIVTSGIKYCRTCYDHLAGFVGVKVAETMEQKALLKKSGELYSITNRGWKWLLQLGISDSQFENIRRPITRQCLDWSERRPHLAGQLGAVLFNKMIERKWFRKVQFSRELVLTSKGRQEIYQMLGLSL